MTWVVVMVMAFVLGCVPDDPCSNYDFNHDGLADWADVRMLLTSETYEPRFDLNDDGVVDDVDADMAVDGVLECDATLCIHICEDTQ